MAQTSPHGPGLPSLPADLPGQLLDGQLRFDWEAGLIYPNEELVSLTPTQTRILGSLVHRLNRIVPPEVVIQDVWGSTLGVTTANLKPHVRSLRGKLVPFDGNLVTRYGYGYGFYEEPPTHQGIWRPGGQQ